MVSSKKISDYPAVQNPDIMIGISKENANHLKKFISNSRLRGVSLNAIKTDIYRVQTWMRAVEQKDAALWTRDDITDAYLAKCDMVAAGEMKATTLDGEVQSLKKFLACIRPGENLAGIIKRRRTKLHRTSDEYLSVANVLDMKSAAVREGNVRDTALIMGLLGTGARASELIDANVGDLEINRQYAQITVDGKTGPRTIPFVTGLPEIQEWVNHHPCRLPDGSVDPAAPLWTTYNTRGHGNRRMSVKTLGNILNHYAAVAGVPPTARHNPHAFRHRCACVMSRLLTQKEMCLYFGWSDDSSMPALYCHTSEEELKRNVLVSSGIVVDDEKLQIDKATHKQCPRCGSVCAADAKYCHHCSLVLDESLLKTYMDIQSDMGDPDIMQVLVNRKRACPTGGEVLFDKKRRQ